MIRSFFLVALLCSLGWAEAFAQQPQKPGPEHARLKEMEGAWDAVMDMGGQKSKATATYKSICDGMWITSDFESNLGGIQYHGHGMDGYDQQKKKYIGYWFDSMSSAPMTFEGHFDADHKVLTMSGTATEPDGQTRKFHSTTEMKGKDQMTFKMFVADADGKDQLAFTIEYSRRK